MTSTLTSCRRRGARRAVGDFFCDSTHRFEEVAALARVVSLNWFVEHAAIPNAIKPVFMNYENAGEASGAYLVALCLKAQAVGDASTRELARRTVPAIVRSAGWRTLGIS